MADEGLKSKIELFIVNKVREIRLEKGITQENIAFHLGISVGFIGQIESSKFRAKYNANHLNELAKLLDCSPRDFWPEEAL
jgi:transcriptional regulator with XRE-family HTH domain